MPYASSTTHKANGLEHHISFPLLPETVKLFWATTPIRFW